MKGFNKLALAAAVAAAPAAAMAMQPMNDSQLSGVSGQSGLTISLGNDITTNVIIHDIDGFTQSAGYSSTNGSTSGAIVMSGVSIQRANTTDTIDLTIDAGTNAAGGAPTLNIGVTIPNNLSVNLGTVQVANSNRTTATTSSWGYTGAVTVMTLGTITLGTTSMNIQLGNEPQGHMITMATNITNGISLSNFSISDAGGTITGGQLAIGNLQVLDNGGTNLNVNADVDIDASKGLAITVNTLGSATGADVRMTGVRLGNAAQPAIGDVEITQLNLTGTIYVSGH